MSKQDPNEGQPTVERIATFVSKASAANLAMRCTEYASAMSWIAWSTPGAVSFPRLLRQLLSPSLCS
jgi:hypothetical protein